MCTSTNSLRPLMLQMPRIAIKEQHYFNKSSSTLLQVTNRVKPVFCLKHSWDLWTTANVQAGDELKCQIKKKKKEFSSKNWGPPRGEIYMLILRAKISLRDAFTYKYFSSSNFAIQKKNSLGSSQATDSGGKKKGRVTV